MQIRVEIEVTPEELRRFLGLPDVSGLQEDIIGFLRDKVGAASEFDAAGFMKNIAAKVRLTGIDEPTPESGGRRGRRRQR
jgi:hypothetical protein